jgi:acyl carrier protein
MNSLYQALVHDALATQLQTDVASVQDADRLEDLGLDALDLVFVVLRLEDLDRGAGDFPLDALAYASTVGDLVALVDLWLEPVTERSASNDTRGKVA